MKTVNKKSSFNLKSVSRRTFLKHTGIVLSALATGSIWSCRAVERVPNFIIIFTDDQGYADVGCYGATGFETPNLDRMAEEGLRFTSFYVSEAVCSASRASLLTGCYAQRLSIRGALMPHSKVGLNPEEETIAELLKKRGYATGMVGKWHLGNFTEFFPVHHGFDEYYGLAYSNDMWPYDYFGKRTDERKAFIYPPLRLVENDRPTDEVVDSLEDQGFLTQKYTRRAVSFIKKHRNKPFFLYLAHSMPHTPINASPAFRGTSRQGLYGDVIQEIDWSVGEILKTLEALGLDDNTLVIFTSDNGPWRNFGNHAGSPGPFREGKGTAWEGGVRVPCLMRWPGKIPAGQVTDELASTLDILPTLCTLAGAPLPQRKIDGVDLSDFILGQTPKSPREEFYYFYTGELRAVRRGKWKLVFPHRYRSYEIVEPGMNGQPGPYGYQTCGLELYNLQEDPRERHDVVASHPEVVAELKDLAQHVRLELGDSLTGMKGKAVRPPGRRIIRPAQAIANLPVGKKIILAFDPDSKYFASGAQTLIDSQLGSDDFHDGHWLGFHGHDLEAVIDLGEMMSIRKIALSLLEDQIAWIFYPPEIEFAVSDDGQDFQIVGHQKIKVEPRRQSSVKIVEQQLSQKARFIRVRAKNVGECPAWHPGHGQKAWLFVDEIIIQ